MKRLFVLGTISTMMVTILSLSLAATNLNSSRSNIYRLVYPADLVSPAQAAAMLVELDKLGPSDEAKLKRWLAANFKRFGIQETRVKRISIYLEQQITCTASVETCKGKYVGHSNLGASKGPYRVCVCYGPITTPTQVRQVNKASPIRILLLTDPADEPQALAVSDPGKGGPKGTKDVP